MNEVFDLIPEKDFIRVHKSFIASLGHITTIEQHQLTINKIKIPVSSPYRHELLKRLS